MTQIALVSGVFDFALWNAFVADAVMLELTISVQCFTACAALMCLEMVVNVSVTFIASREWFAANVTGESVGDDAFNLQVEWLFYYFYFNGLLTVCCI